jgi:hypothetical protein
MSDTEFFTIMERLSKEREDIDYDYVSNLLAG